MNMPHNKLTKKKENNSKAKCDKCGKEYRVRGLVNFKGKFLCGWCRQKMKTFRAQQSASQINKGYISLKEALNRTYEIRKYGKSNGVVWFPSCLAEKFIKIRIVNETK